MIRAYSNPSILSRLRGGGGGGGLVLPDFLAQFGLAKPHELTRSRLAEMKKLLGPRNRLYNDNLKEGLDLIEDLANVFDNWKREYAKVENLGKGLAAPEADYVKYRPDLSEYEQMRKAAGVSR